MTEFAENTKHYSDMLSYYACRLIKYGWSEDAENNLQLYGGKLRAALDTGNSGTVPWWYD